MHFCSSTLQFSTTNFSKREFVNTILRKICSDLFVNKARIKAFLRLSESAFFEGQKRKRLQVCIHFSPLPFQRRCKNKTISPQQKQILQSINQLTCLIDTAAHFALCASVSALLLALAFGFGAQIATKDAKFTDSLLSLRNSFLRFAPLCLCSSRLHQSNIQFCFALA